MTRARELVQARWHNVDAGGGAPRGEERVDLFQKRRAQIYNTGWVESCLPTLLRTETEASPWAAAAEAAQKTRAPGAGRRSSRVTASPQFPNAPGGGYG